ncbi:MAG: mevalonate kinase [Candidatus Woesebacteria bacterium]|jgi:mevalonate kinase
MKKVEVSAPGKLMLFGEHAVIYDKPCIVTSVDQRLVTTVQVNEGNSVAVSAPDVDVKHYSIKIESLRNFERLPKSIRFIGASIHNFFEKYGVSCGLRVLTKSDFSSEFGFGSSSAVTVGILKALSVIFETELTKKDLFEISYKTVLDVQKVGSGFDIAAAIWGGTLYFVKGGKKIVPLKTEKLPLVVGYTGVKANTAALVKKVEKLKKRNKRLVDGIFDNIVQITEKARKHLKEANFIKLGELMDINHGLLASLGVETLELSNLIHASRNAGAYGAKLSGAGGGDCMIAIAPNSRVKDIESAMEKAGGKFMNVSLNTQGVMVSK